jgi:hypothetical protein
MRIMLTAKMCTTKFNAAVRDGSAGMKIKRIMEEIKPEAAYFTEFGGSRTAVLIVDMPDAFKIPALAEPFFLLFDASVEFRPVMVPADLEKAGLDSLGKKWA